MQKTPNDQNNLEKEDKVGSLRLLYFKLYDKFIPIEIMWYVFRGILESLEIQAYIYELLNFDKDYRNSVGNF